jgi:hypothetical protein
MHCAYTLCNAPTNFSEKPVQDAMQVCHAPAHSNSAMQLRQAPAQCNGAWRLFLGGIMPSESSGSCLARFATRHVPGFGEMPSPVSAPLGMCRNAGKDA